ncbi:MAG: metallophosphoesterase family protein [Candidatus Micrarchaeia archaeon]
MGKMKEKNAGAGTGGKQEPKNGIVLVKKPLVMVDEAFRRKLIARLMNHKSTIDSLADNFHKPQDEIIENIRCLQHEKVNILASQSHATGELLYTIDIRPESHNVFFISGPDNKKRVLNFGFASDLHFSSIFHLPESFHEAMKRLEDKGVTRVYVAGDVMDGVKIYSGHHVNLLDHTVEAQTDRAASAFAMHPGMEFWAIAGNHDYSFTKQNGVKPLSILEQKLDNFKNLGDLMADVIYHGIKIRLLHGASGRTYAVSYPSQTYLRDYFRGLEKEELSKTPHILLIGHYHTFYSGKDHGMLVFQPGSFQDGDNEYCVRRGLTGPTGAFHIRLVYQNGQIYEHTANYIQPKAAEGEKGAAFSKTTISYNPAVA